MSTTRERGSLLHAEELLERARAAASSALVPYSNFPVGAAVEASDGAVYSGCNVESASYPLTMCAERVAIFTTIAAGARPLRLAVSCRNGDPADPSSLMPCGACRQVLHDQMGANATVIVDGVGRFTVGELLPKGFHLPSS